MPGGNEESNAACAESKSLNVHNYVKARTNWLGLRICQITINKTFACQVIKLWFQNVEVYFKKNVSDGQLVGLFRRQAQPWI